MKRDQTSFAVGLLTGAVAALLIATPQGRSARDGKSAASASLEDRLVGAPVALRLSNFGAAADLGIRIGRRVILIVVVDALLALLYRFGPSRNRARWRWVSWGSTVAAVAWVAASLAFSLYVEPFGSYNKTYGSLGAVVGFMTWIWISSIVVLMGDEINAELEQQTARDSTEGAEKPTGARGAYKADVKS